MKRDAWLIPLSHDHQHGLVQALRLKRAAESSDDTVLQEAIEDTCAFVARELMAHMSGEEQDLLPVLYRHSLITDDERDRIAGDHLQLRVLSSLLDPEKPDSEAAAGFADLLRSHIRWEERDLFEQVQVRVAEHPDHEAVTRDISATMPELELGTELRAADSPGSQGTALGALNATAITLGPDQTVSECELDRDVAFTLTHGSATIALERASESQDHHLEPGTTIIASRGVSRRIAAGPDGATLVTAHIRRGPLRVQRL